ncbi:FAD-binding oxidoreductase [Sinomonas sp. ASV486]|uniref:FAD-binding oxidoreductase n=1 Tax=Sinomonas sp. ASV486 TaxID=3051170 RepID=UPI0027DCE163|nr:FAD-binding oxidoreductase [Sinomonas sp. ASV486]MDQ4489551.1 FAD-binding oxidoreductase [Sinomonas sp. ASV486]
MSSAELHPDDVAGLGNRLAGELVAPGDELYDQYRHVWNGMIDRRPAMIARCRSSDDVVAAVNFARTHGLLLAVRGGGHSFAGFSTCDGGMVLDLSAMRTVQVDPDRRVARAQGGVTWAVYDAATHAHGLASTGGLVSTTGIAGLTLGGGIGWLQRRWGLACDNLLSAEVVTATGEIVRASESENPELFWGLRGGGGNFGVVTEFEFRLHPVADVIGGLMLFAANRAGRVMRAYRDYVSACPDELTTWLSMVTAPAADFVPAPMHGRPALAVLACHCGDPADAEAALLPLRDLQPEVDLIEPMPYPQLQSMLDEDLPPGVRCYLKSGYTAALTDSLIGVIVEHTSAMPSPASTFDFHHMGGAIPRVHDRATAFGDRRSAFCFNIVGVWDQAEDDDANLAWVRSFASALTPFDTGGVYVNFTAEDASVQAAYGDEKYGRLKALKQQYDPTNLFKLNQNVIP